MAFVGTLGLLAVIVGLISIIWPLKFLKIKTRLQGFAVMALGFAVFAYAVGADSGPPKQAATTATATAKTAEPAAPTYNFTLDVDGKKYQGKTVSDVGVAIVDVSTPNRVGGEVLERKPEGKFVLLQIGVSNHQKDAITVDSNLFKIIANGKEYTGSTEGTTALEMSGKKTFFLKQLNPDMVSMGYLIFDVPSSLDLGSAQLQFHGGMTGGTGTLPLKPITE